MDPAATQERSRFEARRRARRRCALALRSFSSEPASEEAVWSARIEATARHARAVIEPAQGALVVALVHDQLRLLALSEDGRVRHGNRVPIAGHRFDIAAHPGPRDALLLRHRGDRWALEHVRADVSLEPLATFGSERAPSGALAANDTEALVPTAGGKVMRLPLHGSRRSELSPVSDGPVRRMDVVLRPGDSVGAVLYEARRPDGRAHELRLRPLVCAR